MGLPVVIQSTFQIDAVLNTLLGLALAFGLILLLNSFPPLALQFPPPYAAKKAGREEGTLLAGSNSVGTKGS